MQVNAIGSASVGTPTLRAIAGRLAANTVRAGQSLQKLSSGLNLVTAADGPSDLAMSERLRGLFGREQAASNNIENAISYSQTSDSYMQNVQDSLGRMQELAVAANDGTKSSADRQALQAEFKQLQGGIADITSGNAPLASFNGKPLLQGDSPTIAVGGDAGQTLTMTPVDLTTGSATVVGKDSGGNDVTWSSVLNTGAGGMNIATQGAAAQTMQGLSMASDYVSQARATRGSEQERLANTLGGLRESTVNTLMTESRIRDVDVAKELVNLIKFQNLNKLGRGVMAANTGTILDVG